MPLCISCKCCQIMSLDGSLQIRSGSGTALFVKSCLLCFDEINSAKILFFTDIEKHKSCLWSMYNSLCIFIFNE